ncbi:MAG: hypothetical protein U0165_02880 [Polyangiaceae bacterium]
MSDAPIERRESEQEELDLDNLLRRLSRAMPIALVEALVPGTRFEGWEDTQLANRQRRMDRCFSVRRDSELIRVHVEWQTEWRADVPQRVFEYQVLDFWRRSRAIRDSSAHPDPPTRALWQQRSEYGSKAMSFC